MKLRITLIALLTLLPMAILLSKPLPAAATLPVGDSPSCVSDWDGKVLQVVKDKKKIDAYNKSKCDGSYCSTKDTTKGGKKAIKISCQAPTTTTGSGSGTDTSGSATDPAIDYAESDCGKNACNIISKIINPAILLLTTLVGLSIVIGIIFGAIQITTSAGDPQKAASGRNHIRNALIALVAYILFYGFLSFIIPGGIS